MGFLTLASAVGATAVALSGWNVGGGGILPSVDAALFNAIVPNLSTGWFAKPGPSESILFGLIVLKVRKNYKRKAMDGTDTVSCYHENTTELMLLIEY